MLRVIWRSSNPDRRDSGTSSCACWLTDEKRGGKLLWLDVVQEGSEQKDAKPPRTFVMIAEPQLKGLTWPAEGEKEYQLNELDSFWVVGWALQTLNKDANDEEPELDWTSEGVKDLFPSQHVSKVETSQVVFADQNGSSVQITSGAHEGTYRCEAMRIDDLMAALGKSPPANSERSGVKKPSFANIGLKALKGKKKDLVFYERGDYDVSTSFAWGGMGKARYAFARKDGNAPLLIAKEFRLDTDAGKLSAQRGIVAGKKTSISSVDDIAKEKLYLAKAYTAKLTPIHIMAEVTQEKEVAGTGAFSASKTVVKQLFWIMPYAFGDWDVSARLRKEDVATRRKLARIFAYDLAEQIARFQTMDPSTRLVHCDFKLGNTLIVADTSTSKTRYRSVLADFGGVLNQGDPIGVCTAGYVHPALTTAHRSQDFYALARAWFTLSGAYFRFPKEYDGKLDTLGIITKLFDKRIKPRALIGPTKASVNDEVKWKADNLKSSTDIKPAFETDERVANWIWDNVLTRHPDDIEIDHEHWQKEIELACTADSEPIDECRDALAKFVEAGEAFRRKGVLEKTYEAYRRSAASDSASSAGGPPPQ